MGSRFCIALVGCIVCASAAPAQSWSDSLFNERVHDYGTVANGPLLSHYFRITNNTQSPLHISHVRVSCGCVTATALAQDIAPGQSTSIYTTMDTRRFTGSKSVTVHVSFDRPQWSETMLTVNAFRRDDLSLDNDTLTFGTVSRGTPGASKITVTLRQPSWVITNAGSGSTFVEPVVKEIKRTQYEAVYEVAANLKPGLPAGQWITEVTLNTNSTYAPTIRVPAIVEITPALMVSPGDIAFGPTTVGSPSEQRVSVRSTQPFKIKEIQGGDDSVTVSSPVGDAKPMHIVTVKFDPKQTGEINRKLKIVTDLPDDSIAELNIKATAIAKQ